MVEVGGNIYIIGGEHSDGSYHKKIRKLTCVSGTCSWTTLTQKLKVGRTGAVAIPVMDSFCTPNWVNNFILIWPLLVPNFLLSIWVKKYIPYCYWFRKSTFCQKVTVNKGQKSPSEAILKSLHVLLNEKC